MLLSPVIDPSVGRYEESAFDSVQATPVWDDMDLDLHEDLEQDPDMDLVSKQEAPLGAAPPVAGDLAEDQRHPTLFTQVNDEVWLFSIHFNLICRVRSSTVNLAFWTA